MTRSRFPGYVSPLQQRRYELEDQIVLLLDKNQHKAFTPGAIAEAIYSKNQQDFQIRKEHVRSVCKSLEDRGVLDACDAFNAGNGATHVLGYRIAHFSRFTRIPEVSHGCV